MAGQGMGFWGTIGGGVGLRIYWVRGGEVGGAGVRGACGRGFEKGRMGSWVRKWKRGEGGHLGGQAG